MSTAGNRKAALKKLKLLAYNPKYNVEVFRKKIEEAFYSPFLPNHVENSPKNYGEIECDLLIPEIHSTKRILLYIHGGCFTGGSRASYRNFCAVLANRSYSRVVIPEYKLSPEYIFPVAIEDIQNVFRELFTKEKNSLDSNSKNDKEIIPEIIIAADGAGASIASALLLNLEESKRKYIKQVVFFSPWLNFSKNSSANNVRKNSGGIITPDCIQKSAETYAGTENLENYLISPIFAPKELLKNFPPVYIQMGGDEIILEDTEVFKDLLIECKNECRLDVWPNMMHLFQLADEYLDEAHDAFEKFSEVLSGSRENTNQQRQYFENKPTLEYGIRSEA